MGPYLRTAVVRIKIDGADAYLLLSGMSLLIVYIEEKSTVAP